MTTHPQTGLTERIRRHWLSAGTQTMLDLVVLTAAFFTAYLLRFDFQVPRNFWHGMLTQAPIVILMQFAVLSLAGGRSFIWRYAGIAHIRPFLYGGLISIAVT